MTSLKKKIKNPLHSVINSNGMNMGTVTKLQNASSQDDKFVYAMLETSEKGITDTTAEERRLKFGINELQHQKAPKRLMQLLKAFANPFIYILLVIAVVSFVIDVWLPSVEDRDFKTVIVVSVMILVSALLRFVQEYRSNSAAEKLKSMVKTTATVFRKFTGKKEIPISELVPGDIV